MSGHVGIVAPLLGFLHQLSEPNCSFDQHLHLQRSLYLSGYKRFWKELFFLFEFHYGMLKPPRAGVCEHGAANHAGL